MSLLAELRSIRQSCVDWPVPDPDADAAEHLRYIRAQLLAVMMTWRFVMVVAFVEACLLAVTR